MLIKKTKLTKPNKAPLRERKDSSTMGESVPIHDEEKFQQATQELIEQHKMELSAQKKEAEELIQRKVVEAEQAAAEILKRADGERIQVEEYINAEKLKLEQEKQNLLKTFENEKERGYKEGIVKAENYVNELKKILSNFDSVKKKVIEEAKNDLASLAIDIAKKIIQREVTVDKKILEKMIKTSIDKVVTGKGTVKIFVNPTDIAEIKKQKAAIEENLEASTKLVFNEDEKINPGSCVVETQGGRFDSSFSTQIDTIKVAFGKYLGNKIFDLDDKYDGDKLTDDLVNLNLGELEAEDMLENGDPVEDTFTDEEASFDFDEEDLVEIGDNSVEEEELVSDIDAGVNVEEFEEGSEDEDSRDDRFPEY